MVLMVQVAIPTATMRSPFLTLIHPTLMDVLARQTELKAHIVNQMGNAGNHGPRAEPQVNRFAEFFRTNPPIFRGSKDPLDAAFWLNVIEEKLGLIECEPYEKVLFAAHQLHDAPGLSLIHI